MQLKYFVTVTVGNSVHAPDFQATTPAALSAAVSAPQADAGLGDVVAQVGMEVASLTSAALERVNTMMATGRIDRSGLKLLRAEIEAARRSAMLGLQVHRVSSGRLPQRPEVIDVPAMLRQLLALRSRELATRALELRQRLEPCEVRSDVHLLHGALQALLDWALEHAEGAVELQLMPHPARELAELTCTFAHGLDLPTLSRLSQALETMSWRLLQACAGALELELRRQDDPRHSRLSLLLPGLVERGADAGPTAASASAPGGDEGQNSQPLAGSHVLAVAARRDVRAAIRDVARPLGVMLDFVASVDEAREFCAGGLPHALVYEAALGSGFMRRLLDELRSEEAGLAVIEIGEAGRAFEVLNVGGHELTRVSKAALPEALPQALLFALARGR